MIHIRIIFYLLAFESIKLSTQTCNKAKQNFTTNIFIFIYDLLIPIFICYILLLFVIVILFVVFFFVVLVTLAQLTKRLALYIFFFLFIYDCQSIFMSFPMLSNANTQKETLHYSFFFVLFFPLFNAMLTTLGNICVKIRRDCSWNLSNLIWINSFNAY